MCEKKNGLIGVLFILLFVCVYYGLAQQITLEDVVSRQSQNDTVPASHTKDFLSTLNVPLKRLPRNVPSMQCWPKVPFALLRTPSTCPGGGTWSTAAVRHQLRPASSLSHANLLSTQITKDTVTLEFCIRDPPADLSHEPVDYDCSHVHTEFPPGAYCILNAQPKANIYERCPTGFRWSAVGLDDVGRVDGKRTQGNPPTGEYFATFTHYYFCCRNDSEPRQHIILPTRRPFILFPLGAHRACQEVLGLRARMFSIYLDAEHGSYVNYPNKYNSPYAETDSIIEGVGPCAREKRGKGLQLHMCHYSQ